MDRIGAFWQWFTENQDRFMVMQAEGNESLFTELSDELKKLDEHLTFEFSNIQDNGKREFILSANGISKSFPIVFQLHEAAPELQNWDIIALKPRIDHPGDIQLNLSGKIFGIEDIYFEWFKEDDCLSVILYMRADYPENVLAQIGFIFLDLLLGEYDVATKLGHIDFRTLEESRVDGLFELIDLREIMDREFPE
jgi:hypothetical protein